MESQRVGHDCVTKHTHVVGNSSFCNIIASHLSSLNFIICRIRIIDIKSNKSKNKQVGLHQTKKLLHRKVNNKQNEKATYRMGENICKLYVQ